MAKKLTKKATETPAPETTPTVAPEATTPVIESTVTPTVEEVNVGTRVVDETAAEQLPVTTEQTPEAQQAIVRVEPKDLAEAQDLAEAKGIDYVGKTLEQLTSELNGEVPGAKKKALKVKNLIPIPTNIDPAMKAAIEKANAEIAIAQAKVDEAKERLAAERKAAREKLEAERNEKQAKAKAEREAREAADKEASEKIEANKAENEAKLVVAEQTLADKQAAADKALEELNAAKAEVATIKTALGQKVAKAKKAKAEGGVERASNREKDMNKYLPGTTYKIKDGEVEVDVVCKSIFTGSKSGNKFYKFKEVGTGRTIRRRAYAEELSAAQ